MNVRDRESARRGGGVLTAKLQQARLSLFEVECRLFAPAAAAVVTRRRDDAIPAAPIVLPSPRCQIHASHPVSTAFTITPSLTSHT